MIEQQADVSVQRDIAYTLEFTAAFGFAIDGRVDDAIHADEHDRHQMRLSMRVDARESSNRPHGEHVRDLLRIQLHG